MVFLAPYEGVLFAVPTIDLEAEASFADLHVHPSTWRFIRRLAYSGQACRTN